MFVCHSPAQIQRSNKVSKKDLEQKKKKINDEINELNTLLSQTKANKKSSIGALVNISMKLEKRQDLINVILAEIKELNKEIINNEKEEAQLKKSLEKLKTEYARMIVFAQRNQDAYSTLMFIFAAENFTQAYARLKYMQQYSEFRKKQANEIISTQSQLIAKINELKAHRDEKNNLLGNEEREKKTLNKEKAQKEEILTELQQKEKGLKSELQKRKQAAIQLQLAIKNLIEEEIRRKAEEASRAELAKLVAAKKNKEDKMGSGNKKDNGTSVSKSPKTETPSVPVLTEEAEALSEDFSNNRGKLPWPVAKGVICEMYGEHEHPAIKGFMMFNNGLEICVNKDAQARAVFDGEVTSIAVAPTGGKLIIIRHGEYLSVYCNLDEVLVRTGQKVTLKQAIGTVRYNEDEDKTAINLQIWKGQKTMDPSGWLINAK
jgi:septal ring factor EnvC (AmiA/AmiB activator)